ncbi:MAG: hypothetical protein M3295_06225 [Chloroflexota bacterium]|nr:hypothetical protein [Chloroflexota bacterium]
MDTNSISPWARLAAAGQLPISVAGAAEPARVADLVEPEAATPTYVVRRDVAYTELDCICGETHRGWQHREESLRTTSVAIGPLNDRLRNAAYAAYRHLAVECVCGREHPGWDHREAPRHSEPAGRVRDQDGPSAVVPPAARAAAPNGATVSRRGRTDKPAKTPRARKTTPRSKRVRAAA